MIKSLKNVLFKNYPYRNLDEFKTEIRKANYLRAKLFSYILVVISTVIYSTAIISNDLLIIKTLNLFLLVFSIINAILFSYNKPKGENYTRYHSAIIYFMVIFILVWSSSLLALVPNRYELFGTYTIVILTISSVLYLKWNTTLLLYLSSLLYVSVFGYPVLHTPVLPKLTVIVFSTLFAWIISRLLYFKHLQNFIIKSKLKKQKENIEKEVLEKSKQLKKYENKQIEEIVYSITKLLEEYDPYTVGHSENVAALAENLAERLDLSSEEVRDTYWAGMVHDIGKLLIPIGVINKKSELSLSDYEVIKQHPYWGYKALNESDSLKHIAKYVLYHHERWDGKGYPKGLKGEEIPLISQIIAIADCWDAMRSNRSYRDALSYQAALAELKNNSGKQFDPKLVNEFLEIVENNRNVSAISI